MSAVSAVQARQRYIPPERSSAGLGARVISGTLWAMGGTAATAVVQLVSSMVFARMLTPADFGIVAWADVFTQFVMLFTAFGFNVSIVQRKTLDREDLSTVWWSNVAIDLGAALICAVAGFIGARTIANPQVPRVVMLMAIQFAIISLGNVNEALMLRQFMFREMALNNLCGAICGFVVALILTGRFGFGVYGIVISGVAANAIMTFNRLLLVPWLPSRVFSWQKCKTQLVFGSSLLGVTLTGYANGNLDRTTTGALLDSVRLGYFEYASSVPRQIVAQLGTLLNRALFPALASVQGELGEFRRLLLRYIRMTGLVLYPMLVGLALVADEFVLVAYGQQWKPIATPMKIICLAGLINLIANSLIMVCNAIGRPQLAFKASILQLPLNAVATAILVKWAGLTGAAASRCFAPAVTLALLWVWLGRHVRVSARDLVSALAPSLVGCAVMSAVLIAFRWVGLPWSHDPAPTLILNAALGAITYCAVVWIGWHEEVEAIIKLAQRLLSRFVGSRPQPADLAGTT